MLEIFLNGIACRLQKKYKKGDVDRIIGILRNKWEHHVIFANPIHLKDAIFVDLDDDDDVDAIGFNIEEYVNKMILKDGNLLPDTDSSFITILRGKELFEREEAIQYWEEYYENNGLREVFFPPVEVDTINECGEYGRTPMHVAVKENDIVAVCMLADNGADLQMTDNNGHTPLQFAIILGGRDEIVDYLTEIERRQK